MSNTPVHSARLAVVQVALMAAVVAAFVVDSVVDIHADNVMASEVYDLSGNAMPSVEALTRARGVVPRIESSLEQLVNAADGRAESPPEALGGLRQQLDGALTSYLALPDFPGERALHGEVSAARSAFERSSADTLAAVVRSDEPAAQASLGRVHEDGRRLDAAIEHLVEFNADQGERVGFDIASARAGLVARTIVVDGVLAALAMAATVAAAVALRREVGGLQERTSELDTFAGRVAHDLTSPLQAVGVGLEVARAELAGSPRGLAAVQRSERSLARVRGLVDGLLAFARAGFSGTGRLTSDLNEVIRGVLDGVESEAVDAHVELRLVPGPACRVACAPGIVTSLAQNLVTNAIKYMGDSTPRVVTVRTRDAGRFAHVEVEDTGPGIPEAIRHRLFEPFVRGAQDVPGFGLGLATVEKLADAYGGKVGCASKPGGGSLFWFDLPRAAEV